MNVWVQIVILARPKDIFNRLNFELNTFVVFFCVLKESVGIKQFRSQCMYIFFFINCVLMVNHQCEIQLLLVCLICNVVYNVRFNFFTPMGKLDPKSWKPFLIIYW